MTTLRIYLAECWLQLSRWCALNAIDVLPDEPDVQIPLVLPPPYEPTLYSPTIWERQCALLVERYGHTIILANHTAYAVPNREQEGRC